MNDGTEADRICCCCCCIIIRSAMRYGLLQTAVGEEEEELLKRVTDARLSIKRLTPLVTTTTKKKGKRRVAAAVVWLWICLVTAATASERRPIQCDRQSELFSLSFFLSWGICFSLALFRVCWCVCIHNDTTSQPPHNNNGN